MAPLCEETEAASYTNIQKKEAKGEQRLQSYASFQSTLHCGVVEIALFKDASQYNYGRVHQHSIGEDTLLLSAPFQISL